MIVIAASLFACRGNEKSDGEGRQNTESMTPSASPSTSASLSADSSLASSDISSQAGEALSSTMNMDVSSGLSLMLSASMEGSREQSRDCEAGDEHTEVSIFREFSKSFEKSRGAYTFSGGLNSTASLTRIWSKSDGTEIPCNEAATHIAQPLTDFEGVSLSANFSKEMSRSISKTDAEGSLVDSRVRSVATTGSRQVTWDQVSYDEVNGQVTLEKTITLAAESTLTRPDNEGSPKIDTISLVTEEGSPLVVSVTRDAATKQWLERTIISGTTVGTHKDGGSIHISYENAKFEYAQGCEPLDGTITGKIYAAGSESPDRSFVVDLAEASKTITFTDEDGEEHSEELELDGCDLENPKSEVIKRVQKAKQKTVNALIKQAGSASAN